MVKGDKRDTPHCHELQMSRAFNESERGVVRKNSGFKIHEEDLGMVVFRGESCSVKARR